LPAWRHTVGPEVAAFIESQICCYHSSPLAPELPKSLRLPLVRLVRSAYTESELRSFISETGFQSVSIRADGIEFEVGLHKAA
jgi:hypothetical protein